MEVIKYTYQIDGKEKIKKIVLTAKDKITAKSNPMNKIEICNAFGELVYIVRDIKRVKKLSLQKGFYLLREKDLNGNTISRKMLVC